MFLGTFEHTIDTKNRLTLPSIWRKTLVDDKVILSISVDNCIEIRTTESFKDYTNTLIELGQKDEVSRRIQRTIFANSQEVLIDSANRILIPSSLTNLAKITKLVVLFGVGDKIEIWDNQTYNSDRRLSDVNNLSKELESLSSNGK